MALRIEDYAIIGDTTTAALVGRDGSIDWFCAPRFDSSASFAALVGTKADGYWRIAPRESPRPGTGAPMLSSSRQYIHDTLVLETEFTTSTGSVRVTDCMPIGSSTPQIMRMVEGLTGRVEMRMDLVIEVTDHVRARGRAITHRGRT